MIGELESIRRIMELVHAMANANDIEQAIREELSKAYDKGWDDGLSASSEEF